MVSILAVGNQEVHGSCLLAEQFVNTFELTSDAK